MLQVWEGKNQDRYQAVKEENNMFLKEAENKLRLLLIKYGYIRALTFNKLLAQQQTMSDEADQSRIQQIDVIQSIAQSRKYHV